MNSDTSTLDEGQVVLQWPTKMSPESYDDFKAWLDLMAKRIKRASEKTDPPSLPAILEKASGCAHPILGVRRTLI